MKKLTIRDYLTKRGLIAFVIIGSLVLSTLMMSGCSKKEEPEPEPEPVEEVEVEEPEVLPENINYLTGELLPDGSTAHARPAAIIVENSWDARPQWGMDDPDNPPDIILEAEVEGGITRLMWFYEDFTKVPSEIGPLRSARPPFIKFSELFDAIFVHWGMSHSYGNYVGADEVFETDKVDHINEMTNGEDIFGRNNSRDVATEHTGVLFGNMLPTAIEGLGFRTEINPDAYTRFKFNEKVEPLDGDDCNTLTTNLSSNTDQAIWTFDQASGKYTTAKFENGVTRDNLLVLFDTTEYVFRDNYNSDGSGITYTNYLLTGGTGKYASGGKAIDIKWTVEEGKIKLTDADGNELLLNPGKTWIGWGSSNNGGSISVQ